MDLFKKIIGIKSNNNDNIPEIHLVENEIKCYYDQNKKKWVFEDQDETEEKSEKIIPKKNTIIQNKKNFSKKWACFFSDNSIIDSNLKNEFNNEIKDSKEYNSKNLKQLDKENKIIKNSYNKNLEINKIEEINIISNIYKIDIEKLKKEFLQQISIIENNYEIKVNELNETTKFYEENYQESTTLLKEKINSFINENLELKLNLDKIRDELQFKKKENEEYKELFEQYKKIINETAITKSENKIEYKNENLLLCSKIEKLESEKMILNNDILELKVKLKEKR